jgi:hypothetical protein
MKQRINVLIIDGPTRYERFITIDDTTDVETWATKLVQSVREHDNPASMLALTLTAAGDDGPSGLGLANDATYLLTVVTSGRYIHLHVSPMRDTDCPAFRRRMTSDQTFYAPAHDFNDAYDDVTM